MNEELVRRHNEVVDKDGIVYVLGDSMLGPDPYVGINFINQMNGKKIMILGNHDTKRRVEVYDEYYIPTFDALRIEYKGYKFFLCHYPAMTANFESNIKECTISLFGHTHQQNSFCNEMPWLYHVGADSHDCYPVLLDNVIQEIKDKVKECKIFL